MNWIEYARMLSEYRARFGRMPSSMLTDDGAIDQMQEALGGSSEKRRAAAEESDHTVGHGIRRRREQGH